MLSPASSLRLCLVLGLVLGTAACADPEGLAPDQTGTLPTNPYLSTDDSLRFAGEVHLRNIRQLTFGGNNAEAYWSYDDEQLVFQSDWTAINDQGCDQIYVMPSEPRDAVGGDDMEQGGRYQLVSTGDGRTTCGFFLPDGRVIYGSTHEGSRECPEAPSFSQGRYVWPIYETYDIYVTDSTGLGAELLIGGPGYDAEATVSPDGRYVVFTSTRSGDLELWRYDMETEELLQLTDELLQLTDTLGYDGGAFFSPDGERIVWRASRVAGDAAETYVQLLRDGFVEPSALDIYVADADGSNPQRVTNLPGANWAPYFHPSGEKIIFASNHHTMDEGGREFDLFLVNVDGTGLERVTHSGTFDAFPMFSYDGSRLVFASNRNLDGTPSRDTNIFVADWVDAPSAEDSSFVQPRRARPDTTMQGAQP